MRKGVIQLFLAYLVDAFLMNNSATMNFLVPETGSRGGGGGGTEADGLTGHSASDTRLRP